MGHKKKRKLDAAKKVLFHNCIIQAPDGVCLSRCGLSKLQWYINQGLADLIPGSDPLTIRLRFEPSGREGMGDPLIMEGKPNLCVACGTDKDLTRHHIIPYCFIRHMKLEYKMDIVRDIFPLCRQCHNEYEAQSEFKREELAERCGITKNGNKAEKVRQFHKTIGAASALVKHGEKIPSDRKEKLLSLVKTFLGKEEVSSEELESVRRLQVEDHEDYVNVSKHIAESVKDYNEFAQEWRTHFVETMKPKHMPEMWKVDRKTENVWIPLRVLKQHQIT